MKISKTIKTFVVAAAIAISGVLGFALAPGASAVDCPSDWTLDEKTHVCMKNNANGEADLWGIANKIINVILAVVGFITVVMIILGGISYTTSAGDSAKVKKAKDTILYGIIGLVICVLAFAIVNFVLTNIFK